MAAEHPPGDQPDESYGPEPRSRKRESPRPPPLPKSPGAASRPENPAPAQFPWARLLFAIVAVFGFAVSRLFRHRREDGEWMQTESFSLSRCVPSPQRSSSVSSGSFTKSGSIKADRIGWRLIRHLGPPRNTLDSGCALSGILSDARCYRCPPALIDPTPRASPRPNQTRAAHPACEREPFRTHASSQAPLTPAISVADHVSPHPRLLSISTGGLPLPPNRTSAETTPGHA